MKELTNAELEEIRGNKEWEYGRHHLNNSPGALDNLVLKCESCNKFFKSLRNCDKCGSDKFGLFYQGLPSDEAQAAFLCHNCFANFPDWICPRCDYENPVFYTVQWPKKSCFIATAVYGAPSSPEVEVLRHFRDNHLLRHKIGKLFVKYYYEHSPYLANLVSEYKILRLFVKYVILQPAILAVRRLY